MIDDFETAYASFVTYSDIRGSVILSDISDGDEHAIGRIAAYLFRDAYDLDVPVVINQKDGESMLEAYDRCVNKK